MIIKRIFKNIFKKNNKNNNKKYNNRGRAKNKKISPKKILQHPKKQNCSYHLLKSYKNL
jgi:hypothetical protein